MPMEYIFYVFVFSFFGSILLVLPLAKTSPKSAISTIGYQTNEILFLLSSGICTICWTVLLISPFWYAIKSIVQFFVWHIYTSGHLPEVFFIITLGKIYTDFSTGFCISFLYSWMSPACTLDFIRSVGMPAFGLKQKLTLNSQVLESNSWISACVYSL